MMTIHEQLMCELQADVFEQSTNRFKCGSSFFVSKFMYSELAKELDDIDNPYNYSSAESILNALEKEYPSLNKEGDKKYSKESLRWLGYIYRAWSIIKHKHSSYLYKYTKAEQMFALYDSFHTFGVEYCVDKLEELANEIRPQPLTDEEMYQLYKKIKLEDMKKRGIAK